LPALEHHAYSEDVEEGGMKINKTNFFFLIKMEIFLGRRLEKRKKLKINKTYFYSKSPLLDVGGFTKQGTKKYSPKMYGQPG
jgi:hypothetical protein